MSPLRRRAKQKHLNSILIKRDEVEPGPNDDFEIRQETRQNLANIDTNASRNNNQNHMFLYHNNCTTTTTTTDNISIQQSLIRSRIQPNQTCTLNQSESPQQKQQTTTAAAAAADLSSDKQAQTNPLKQTTPSTSNKMNPRSGIVKMLNRASTNKSPLHMNNRAKIRLGVVLGALCLVGLLGVFSFGLVSASEQQSDYSNQNNPTTSATTGHQQQQQQQKLISNEASYDAPGARDQNQVSGQQHGPQSSASGKSKKIQIVYIKVPLAKLKPSLNSSDDFTSNKTNYSASSNSSAPAGTKGGQAYGANATNEVLSTKSQGSQTAGQDGEPGAENEPEKRPGENSGDSDGQAKSSSHHFHHSSSLLIPMAVVQESNSASFGPDTPVSHSSSGSSPLPSLELTRTNGAQLNNNNYDQNSLMSLPFHQHQHQQQPIRASQNRLQMYQANSVWPELFTSHQAESPLMHAHHNQLMPFASDSFNMAHYNNNNQHRKSRANNNDLQHFNMNNAESGAKSLGLGQGFMSSFLAGEREKLNAMMQQQLNVVATPPMQFNQHQFNHQFAAPPNSNHHNNNNYHLDHQQQHHHLHHSSNGPVLPEQSQNKPLLAAPNAREQPNHQHQHQTNAQFQSPLTIPTTTSSSSSSSSSLPPSASSSTMTVASSTTTNNPVTSPASSSPSQSMTLAPNSGASAKQTGGLMPMVVMPASEMPDNMIGQAYGAAVRQALPIESGSPGQGMLSGQSSLLEASSSKQTSASNSGSSSPSSGPHSHPSGPASYAHSSKSSPGSSRGTAGDGDSYWPSSSSASSSERSPGQPDHSSSGSSSQNSGSGYSGSGASSGYGSGINSFGASVAFSDFPSGSHGAQPTQHHTSQQHHHHQSASSGANGYGSSHENQLADGGAYGSSMKLKQAKKTIIPIVVQVEHGILENNSLQGTGYGFRQQPSNNKPIHQSPPAHTGQSQYRSPFAALKRGRQIQNNQNNQNNYHQQQMMRNNNYQAGKTNQGIKGQSSNQMSQYQVAGAVPPYSSASSNEITLNSLLGAPASGAQFVNAANAQDINKITAAINAENAANAAAALAQADMAFGDGVPAYIMSPQQQHQAGQHQGRPHHGPSSAISQYASGLQSAASALLAQTHPMIQAAASNGIGSVSKLGAKLGEIMSLPSMQVPSVVNSLSNSLPVALSSWSTQVGAGLNQAVQQVAKEHPTAHAFARQIAQQAGLQLPQQFMASMQQQDQQSGDHNQQHQQHSAHGSPQSAGSSLTGAASSLASSLIAGVQQQQQPGPSSGPGVGIQQVLGNAAASLIPQQALSSLRNVNRLVAPLSYQNLQAAASQMMTSGSSFLPTQMVPGPQSSLQQLRQNLGANLQTAAAQLMAASQKTNAQSAATLLQSPLSSLYPSSVQAALKQLSGVGVASGATGAGGAGAPVPSSAQANADSHHAQSSSLVPVQSSPDSLMSLTSHLNGSPLMLTQQFNPANINNNHLFSKQFQQQANADGQSQINQQDSGASAQGAQSSSLSLTEALQNVLNGNKQSQQQQVASAAGGAGKAGSSSSVNPSSASGSKSPASSSSFKTKFLSFFQPPKFISNLLSWNDRAGERQDLASGTQTTANLNAASTSSSSSPQLASSPATTTSTTSATSMKQDAATVAARTIATPA